MATHIYLESSFKDETYFIKISALIGSYFEKIGNSNDKAIITSINRDFVNRQQSWCAEIVESSSYPLIKYYHFKNVSDLIDVYETNKYNFITNAFKKN